MRSRPAWAICGTCPRASWAWIVEHDFDPNYQPIKGKEDIIKRPEEARPRRAARVYLATDPDREGEAISWHLKELLDLPDDKT